LYLHVYICCGVDHINREQRAAERKKKKEEEEEKAVRGSLKLETDPSKFHITGMLYMCMLY
jgi:hypothetical protein